jgi:hypothetical protein
VQLAGIANLSAKSTTDAQLAGIVNVAQSAHFQGAGIANLAYNNGKVQVAGIANLSPQKKTYAQVAGIVNVADTSLFQAGLVNVARRSGVQVGLVNVCDTSEGVMVGLVNVARKGGLYEFEVSMELVNQINLAYRMGTRKFYTFAEVSYRWDDRLWLHGIGFGTQIPLSKGWGVGVEGLSQSVFEKRFWEHNGLNMLMQVRVAATKQLAEHFSVFAGPTFSVYCADYTNPASLTTPYHIFSYKGSRIATKAWVGFSVGVRVN